MKALYVCMHWRQDRPQNKRLRAAMYLSPTERPMDAPPLHEEVSSHCIGTAANDFPIMA